MYGVAKPDEYRQLLAAGLYAQLRQRIEELSEAQPGLLLAYRHLGEGLDLRPVQCDRAVIAVNALGTPARELYLMIKETDSLAAPLLPIRHHLFAALCYAQEQAQKSVAALTQLRPICRDNSPVARRHRVATQRHISELIDTGGAVTDYGFTLLSQVRAVLSQSPGSL